MEPAFPAHFITAAEKAEHLRNLPCLHAFFLNTQSHHNVYTLESLFHAMKYFHTHHIQIARQQTLCPARAALCLSRSLCTLLARRLWLRRDGFCSAASEWGPLCPGTAERRDRDPAADFRLHATLE